MAPSIESLDLPVQFGVRAPKPPAMPPCGLVVASVSDTPGALWHFTRRDKAAA